MKSRAARQILLILFIVSLGATAYLFRNGESLARSEAAALRAFEEKVRITTRALLDTRAAQQAYVADGQAGDFWPGKVAQGITAVKGGLAALRDTASSSQARAELEGAIGKVDDFAAIDRRARDYRRAGQNLLASDVIFGEGLETSGAIDARLEQARAAEVSSAEAAIATYRSRQVFALTAGAAAAGLIVLLLLPAGEPSRSVAQSASAAERAAQPALALRSPGSPLFRPNDEAEVESVPDLPIESDGWSRPAASAQAASEQLLEVTPASGPARAPEPEAVPQQGPAAPLAAAAALPPIVHVQKPATDFRRLASLCTDLARVIDTHELPSLLDRASTVLDARGIILWIADPDGRELNPIVAHGYPAQLVNRLGTIARDAENATAAAFRTSLLQTVKGDAESHGAIVAPLVTPGGCVGVMAAELRSGAATEESRTAAAAILAAQLATLVGPPLRTHEAANA